MSIKKTVLLVPLLTASFIITHQPTETKIQEMPSDQTVTNVTVPDAFLIINLKNQCIKKQVIIFCIQKLKTDDPVNKKPFFINRNPQTWIQWLTYQGKKHFFSSDDNHMSIFNTQTDIEHILKKINLASHIRRKNHFLPIASTINLLEQHLDVVETTIKTIETAIKNSVDDNDIAPTLVKQIKTHAFLSAQKLIAIDHHQ